MNSEEGQERSPLTSEDRMEIIAAVNQIVHEEGRRFPKSLVQVLVDLLPELDKYQAKWPYFGRIKKSKRTEGHAAGIGSVSISTEQKAPDTQGEKMLPFRFGKWEVQRVGRVIHIDHMWSHHVGSSFAGMSAELRYEIDEDGAVKGAFLYVLRNDIRWHFRIVPCPYTEPLPWKWDDETSEKEMEEIWEAYTAMRQKDPTPIIGGALLNMGMLMANILLLLVLASLFSLEQMESISESYENVKVVVALWVFVLRSIVKGYRVSLLCIFLSCTALMMLLDLLYLFIVYGL